jgi:hypothetical protein
MVLYNKESLYYWMDTRIKLIKRAPMSQIYDKRSLGTDPIMKKMAI